MKVEEILDYLNENKIVFDVKNILDKEKLISFGVDYWRL